MIVSPDRVAFLENRLRVMCMAAKHLGFDTKEADDIFYIFQEVRFYAMGQVHEEDRAELLERFSRIFTRV
mgnify:CR=1 FL=1